jgi:outer membrane protein assembly factor BamD (BamD/ComL family)
MAGGRTAYVDPKKRKEPPSTNTVDKTASKRPKMQSLGSQKKVDDWKIYTVHDASMYATITAFLAQDAIAEAFQKLTDWENESPQSKLTGEFPLTEAKVYVHVEDYRRAINALEAYRKSVTMSAQLADAMKLEIDCLQRINDTTRAKEIAADFLKRFPGHPFEAAMKEVLAP